MKFPKKFFSIKAVGKDKNFFEIRAKEATMIDMGNDLTLRFLICQAINLYQASYGLWRKEENGEFEAQDIFKWSDSLSTVILERNAEELKKIGCYSSL